MSEVTTSEKLQESFLAVFPNVKPTDVATLSAETFSDWDSVAQVTLISVLEEEFGFVLPEEKCGELLSFQAWRKYLESLPG